MSAVCDMQTISLPADGFVSSTREVCCVSTKANKKNSTEWSSSLFKKFSKINFRVDRSCWTNSKHLHDVSQPAVPFAINMISSQDYNNFSKTNQNHLIIANLIKKCSVNVFHIYGAFSMLEIPPKPFTLLIPSHTHRHHTRRSIYPL